MPFPKNFFWGAATASYQVEGGIENCDWAEAARNGQVPACGKACDHYTKFESDFDLAKSIGHNCHRVSIEWARIEPEEGKFNEQEIEHYKKVIMALRERNMEPFVTLWHFTLPTWFARTGGWLRKDSHTLFARYCSKMVDTLSPLAVHFATMNEPMVYVSQGWMSGNWPPFQKNSLLNVYCVAKKLIKGHIHAYRACKEVCPTCVISLVKHNIYFHYNHEQPLYKRWFHALRAKLSWYFWNTWFLNGVMGHTDVIGLNYYRHHEFGAVEKYPVSDMGWELYPRGLCHLLADLKKYNLPLYVAEAGIADADDNQRAEYIEKLVAAMECAIEDGADVRGFMYWSLLDNYEWSFGFTKRFGLIEINYDTLERSVRPSAYQYKEIIERNGMLDA